MADMHNLIAALSMLGDDAQELLDAPAWAAIEEALRDVETGYAKVVAQYGSIAPEGVSLNVGGSVHCMHKFGTSA